MDLSLDLSATSPTYRDLAVVNGDLALTSDAPGGSGPGYIQQTILQRLRLFRGEWFLNLRLGVPYYQQILVKSPNQAAVDIIIQNTILQTPGVLRLQSYQSSISRAQRILTVKFLAVTTRGLVAYDGPLNNASGIVGQ